MQISDAIQLPEFESALGRSVQALRRLAQFELEPAIQRRMLELGERKERLSAEEHEELLALVEFSEQRSIERLEAQVVLRQLEGMLPDLVEAP